MNVKRVLPLSLTVLSLSVVCGSAMAKGYPAEIEEDLIKVCRTAAEDNRLGLRQAVQQFNPSSRILSGTYRMLADGLVCNDMHLVAFAQYYGAVDTTRVLQGYGSPRPVIEIQDMQVSRVLPEDIKISFTVGR